MPSSQATVTTDRPQRYIKQLVSHFGTKVDGHLDDDGNGTVGFPFGRCTLTARTDAIVLAADADDAESLTRLQDVVGSHLVRFGTKDELSVDWTAG